MLLYSNTFRVTSECGIDSTDVIRPNLYDIDRDINTGSSQLRIEDDFISSNPNCPI